MVTKSCKGRTCTDPWSVIHPAGDVKTLREALDTRFDAFYETEVKERVRFERCELGYILASEGPQQVLEFKQDKNELWTLKRLVRGIQLITQFKRFVSSS
jgi:N-acetylglucosamine-6-sulfatase